MSHRTAHLMFVLGVALLVLMFAASNVGAQSLASGNPDGSGNQDGRRVALVIGNGAYTQASALPNPVNDAVDLTARLQALGFEVIDGYDLDYGTMQSVVRDFARALEGADIGLFFYAGHGLQVDGRNYMVPVDATLSDESAVDFETIDMNLVLDQLARNPDRTSIILLDACRDNPLAANLARQAAAARSAAVGRGLAQIESVAAGTLIAYSTQPGAIASDGEGRNSPFTSAILHHIETPGLEVQQLMRRVRASVIEGSDGLQIPWDNSSLTDNFYFSPPLGENIGPPSIESWAPPHRDPTPRQIEIGLWNDVKDTGAIEELQAYLDQYPTGVFANAARARIERFAREASAAADQAAAFASAIAAEFAELTGRGSIIEEPTEPLDFYANARLYELRGDFLNARQSYLGLFNFELEYVDPHYRFQTFLKVQEGRAGAREIYNELVDMKPADTSRAYAAALLFDAPQRIVRLNEHIAAYPDFAPAYYELSRDFSQARLGSQTLADKRRERDLLEQFLQLSDDGAFLRYFIDQRMAAEQLDDARTRLTSLEAFAPMADNPVSFIASNHNSGWTLSFSIPEAVREILVATDGGPYRSTGSLPNTDPRSGLPMARPFTELARDAGPQEILLKYVDLSGVEQGPYAFQFNPAAALVEGAMNILEMTRTSWVSIRDDADYPYTYFSHLMGYRCAIDEVLYGWDDDTPAETFELPACDPTNPNATPSDATIFISTDTSAEAIFVQLRYATGEMSEVQRFSVPH